MGETADILEVARFSTLPEAELAVSFLQQHGIRAWLPDRDTATVNPDLLIALGGVRVVTASGQIVQARELIARMRAGEFATGPEDESGDWQDEHTPGRVGELGDHQIWGVMALTKKAGVVVIALFLVVFPVTSCVVTALGG